jgi:outer membrane biosynthesis protein TonB
MQDDSKKSKIIMTVIGAVVTVVLVAGVVMLYRFLASDDGKKRQRKPLPVTLLKPPPPPKIKEKPPEPEIKKKEEVIEQKVEEKQEDQKQDQDEPPPSDRLGLDADGTAGSDGFGLAANKGGRALIGGGGGSLLAKYAFYTSGLQEEIRKRLREHLEANGGIPQGDLKTMVKITLDEQGKFAAFDITGSSGNHQMDEAVAKVLGLSRTGPPPEGMPRTVKLQISSKG